ncbi:fimbrial protein [Burkholderia ubonensis]|uniref:fimbrial protein n=1 Tax=Burkholderia ubonensis TaxID=101571 RepID=UPI000B1D3100|nr:hypothetical protein [Burkholderia ubonensis]
MKHSKNGCRHCCSRSRPFIHLKPDKQLGSSIAECRRKSGATGHSVERVRLPPSSSATITVPLLARYYQTDAMAAPGTADGIATFTIVYR